MVHYDDWGNEKPSWSRARLIRTVACTILLLGAVGGAAYGIYSVTHKRKHNGGSGGSPESGPGFSPVPITTSNYTFPNAMAFSLQFLNTQKSGKLPTPFPVTWRSDSCLLDGQDVGLDLSGGLYDAGDHVKFGLPLAYTGTILAWSVLEYSTQMRTANQLDAAVDIVKWIADYLVKAHPSSDVFYFQVGDPDVDHKCWQRAEDVDETMRPSYQLNSSFPGSDVAGESSAALAAASIVFRTSPYTNTTYADILLRHARDLLNFAMTYQAKYSESFPDVAMYYDSTGYEDELLWANTWLYQATGEDSFLQYVTGTAGSQYGQWGHAPLWLSWDDKTPAVQVLLSRNQLLKPPANNLHASQLNKYKSTADLLMCALLPNSPSATKKRTKNGMIWVTQWSASIETVNAAFLALVYSDYILASKTNLVCDEHTYAPAQLRHFAFTQVDYLLGNNPAKTSFLVGYGTTFPQYLHHRGASIPVDNIKYGCNQGFQWLSSTSPNPNVAFGALVGGPFFNETYVDSRNNTGQNEAGTYNSATLAGLLAGLSYINKAGVPIAYLS